MLGIPHPGGEEGKQLELAFNRQISQAHRLITPDMKSERIDRFQDGARSGNSHLVPDLVTARRYELVKKIKDLFLGHLIRRTITSKLADGNPISILPPKRVHSLPLKLSDAEMQLVNDALDESSEESKKKKANFDFDLRVSLHCSKCMIVTHSDVATRISSRGPASQLQTRTMKTTLSQ